ncbi:MAG: nucleotidyltransferase family protein [Pseudomonadota bacterium]
MNAAPQSALVLAAGRGTRMRPLTERMPKALVPVAGRALVDRALDHVTAAGIEKATVNLHHFADQLDAHLSTRSKPMITLSDERDALLDTGGGLAAASHLLGDGPVITLNADAVFAGPEPLMVLKAAWADCDADLLMLLVPREATVGYTRPGDFFLAHDGAAPHRRGPAPSAPFVFTGAQIAGPRARTIAASIADEEPVFSLNLVWDRLLSEGRLAAVRWPVGPGTAAAQGAWADVGTPAGIAEAEGALARWSATEPALMPRPVPAPVTEGP